MRVSPYLALNVGIFTETLDMESFVKPFENLSMEEFLDRITEFTNNIPVTSIVSNDDIKSRRDLLKYIYNRQRNDDDTYNVSSAQWDHFKKILGGKDEVVKRNYCTVKSMLTVGFKMEYIVDKFKSMLEVDALREVIDNYHFELERCMRHLWLNGGIPARWKEGTITLQFKSPNLDKGNVNSFSPYFTPNLVYKVWTRILIYLLNKEIKMKEITAPGQVQWSRGVIESDVTFTLCKLIQKEITDTGGKVYVFFAQLKDPYAHVIWDRLFDKMRTYDIDKVLISRIEEIYEETIYKCGNLKFWATRGLKIGCPLSMDLFHMYIADLEKWLQDGQTKPLNLGNIKFTAFYDSKQIAILARTADDLMYLMNRFDEYLTNESFEINVDDSKVMLFSRDGLLKTDKKWKCGLHEIDTVTTYTFIGYTFTSDGSEYTHIQKSVQSRERNLQIIKTIDRKLIAKYFSDWTLLYKRFVYLELPPKWWNTSLIDHSRRIQLDFGRWILNLPDSTSDDEVMEIFNDRSYVEKKGDNFGEGTCVAELVKVLKDNFLIKELSGKEDNKN